MDEHFLTAILQREIGDKNISHVFSIEKSPAVSKGDNYLSIVTRVKLHVLMSSGRKAYISLIIKEFPDGEGKKQIIKETGAFKREVQVYMTVLKEMENLMYEKEVKEEYLWADLVGFCPYDLLIFRDLGTKNYKVPPRSECQDLNHGLLSMVELARFHAMSKVLMNRGLIRKDEFPCGNFMCNIPETYYKTAGPSIKRMGEIMELHWGPEWINLGKKVQKCVESNGRAMIALGGKSEEKFKVLNHGDPWTSNMMFKYSVYDARPVSLKFVDFQMCHIDSFAWDLTYYMYTSIVPEIRRQNYNNLLKKYSESLISSMEIFCMPKSEIPTYDDVLKEMERLKPFRVCAVGFFYAIMTYKGGDGWDLDESMNSLQEKPPKDECFLENNFKEKIGPDVEEFAKIGLI